MKDQARHSRRLPRAARSVFYLLIAASMVAQRTAAGESPEVTDLARAFAARPDSTDPTEFAEALISRTDLDALSGGDFMALRNVVAQLGPSLPRVYSRLSEVAANPSSDGECASITLAYLTRFRSDLPMNEATAILNALSHGWDAPSDSRLPIQVLRELIETSSAETLASLCGSLRIFDSTRMLELAYFVFVVALDRADVPNHTKAGLRDALSADLHARGQELRLDRRDSSETDRKIQFIDSKYARGEVLGHALNSTPLLWASDENHKTLSDYADGTRIVLIDFWATWCIPCRDMEPMLRHVQAKYPPVALKVVSVTIECDEDVEASCKSTVLAHARRHDMNWHISAMTPRDALLAFGVRTIPLIVLVSRSGEVVYVGSTAPGKADALDNMIDGMLRNP